MFHCVGFGQGFRELSSCIVCDRWVVCQAVRGSCVCPRSIGMSRGLAWGMWGESGHCAIDGQTGLGSMLGGRRVCMSSTYVPSLECRRRPLRRRRRRRRCGAAEIAGPAARLQAPLACLCLALFACNYICSACKGHAGLRRTGGEEFTQGFGIHAPTCSSARILPQHPGCGAGAWTASVGWQDGLRRRLTQCACWAAGAGIRRWAVFFDRCDMCL